MSGPLDDLDPEDRDLARRLAGADFAADSRVRADLRARLLARPRAPRSRYMALPALAAAALAVLLVAPLFEHHPYPMPQRYERGEHGLPVLPGSFGYDAAAAARVEETPTGSRVVWDVDGDRYVLESRRVTIDDIFVRR